MSVLLAITTLALSPTTSSADIKAHFRALEAVPVREIVAPFENCVRSATNQYRPRAHEVGQARAVTAFMKRTLLACGVDKTRSALRRAVVKSDPAVSQQNATARANYALTFPLLAVAGLIAERFGVRNGGESAYPDVAMDRCPSHQPGTSEDCPDFLEAE